MKQSAGILLYRRSATGTPEVLLVHPGGPWFRYKDDGSWTIPKGEPEVGEDLLDTAVREFQEELGVRLQKTNLRPLKPVKQKGGKLVTAFAVEQDLDCSAVHCNEVEMEFPYKSGKWISFPEIDKAEWFAIDLARQKINPAQQAFLDELTTIVV